MRFLVDRCAGTTLAKWLRDHGHDIEDASEWSVDPGDAVILQRAFDEDRILVTIDTDFGLLVYSGGRPHRGLVRLPDCPPRERLAILSELLVRHGADLESRAVITVRGGRIRVSRSE